MKRFRVLPSIYFPDRYRAISTRDHGESFHHETYKELIACGHICRDGLDGKCCECRDPNGTQCDICWDGI